MPVYNAEKYLAETIESVLKQSFSDFELLIINDGSEDSSADICKDYQKRDKRIVYLCQENHGISYTRNKGIKEAAGEYIAFCDHDDLYTADLLADNIKLIEQYGADFVKYGRTMMLFKGEKTECYQTTFQKDVPYSIKRNEFKLKYPDLSEGPLLLYVWDGIFRKSFILDNNILFDESMKAGEEDRNFMFECLRKAEQIVVNPKIYYTHILRQTSSTSSKFNFNRCKSVEISISNEKNLINELRVADCKYWESQKLNYLKIYLDNLIKASQEELTFDKQYDLIAKFVIDNDIQSTCLSTFLLGRYKSYKNLIILILLKIKAYGYLLKLMKKRHYG